MSWLTTLSVEFVPGEYAARTLDWLRYQDEKGYEHAVPAGFYTDFGSVPGYTVLHCLVPRIGRVRESFVLHDYEYRRGCYPRSYADHLLLTSAFALLDSASDFASGERAVYKARVALAYAGVRMWGWIPWRRYRNAD